MTAGIELSWQEYDFLWEHFQLGPRPTVLDIDSHGYTPRHRAELRDQAWASLELKDLGWPGEFDPRLERRLRLLARPEWEVDGRLHLSTEGSRTSALIGARGDEAALGVLEPERLTLRSVSATGLARAAVSVLPPHPAGTGPSITLPAETLDVCAARAGSNRDAFLRALVSEGLGKAEARKIVEVTGHTVRFGHFGAARTRTHGRRVRAGHVVSMYDNPEGRYLFTRRPDGRRLWVTLVPATDTAIARQLDELLTALA